MDLKRHSAELASLPAVSVVIRTFSRDRWDGLRGAVASVHDQTVKSVETVVVTEYNPELIVAATVLNVGTSSIVIGRKAFDAVDGFRKGFGKVDARSRLESTDLCLRAAECAGGGIWICEPGAIARHQVPADGPTLHNFLKRCHSEGQGEAALASLNVIPRVRRARRQHQDPR